MNDDIAFFLKRLNDNFTAKELNVIKTKEVLFEKHIKQNLNGHAILIDSFQEYFIETISLAYQKFKGSICFNDKDYQWYLSNLANYITIFKSIRSAELSFYSGYPCDGFAQLRDLIDQSIFITAIIKGVSTFSKVKGWEDTKETDWRKYYSKVAKKRKAEQHEILDKMLFKCNEFSNELLQEIKLWRDSFHEEVHGSGWTYAFELNNLMCRPQITLFPEYDEKVAFLYMNRICEITWIILRCFPFLQIKENGFGTEWSQKWYILDESFQFMVKGFNLGVSNAVITLINCHFAYFPESTFYIESK